MRYVIFRSNGKGFALPLEDVREVVVVPQSFTRVPRAGVVVRGVTNLRGRIVTVVDFARLMDSASEPINAAGEVAAAAAVSVDKSMARLVLLEGKLRDIALLVDEVMTIQECAAEVIAEAGSPPEVRGTSQLGDIIVTILSSETMLDSVRKRLAGGFTNVLGFNFASGNSGA